MQHKYSWIAIKNLLRSSLSMSLSMILLSFNKHLIIRPASFGMLISSFLSFSRVNRTTKMYVWLQFSNIRNIEEFKFFRMSSPSLFWPILSRFSIRSLVKSYSASWLTCVWETSFMISLDAHVLFTIVIKYLVNLKGISCTGYLNMSSITWVNASIN